MRLVLLVSSPDAQIGAEFSPPALRDGVFPLVHAMHIRHGISGTRLIGDNYVPRQERRPRRFDYYLQVVLYGMFP